MKRVLLIAGGGTLGLYAAQELVKLGFHVDDVCLDDHLSDNPNLTFIKAAVDNDFLTSLFKNNHYDAIVDFLHYPDAQWWYAHRRELLLKNTQQLIFLSSYRVYADEEHPIRETSPQWLDVSKDEAMLKIENYAIPKSKCERHLQTSGDRNWTIIRPLISFSHFRLDLVTLQSGLLLDRILKGKEILLPAEARNTVAGVGWAGNVGKMIAHLVLKEKAYGEAFTLGAGENRTWGDVAQCYTDLFGARFVWVDSATYMTYATNNTLLDHWILFYDRLLNRSIDNAKVLEATGLRQADFVNIREALAHEMDQLQRHPEWTERLRSQMNPQINAKMDAYLQAQSL